MEWKRLVVCLVFCVSLCHELLAFNLEPRLAIVKEGPENSYFGYATAPHIVDGGGSFLLVGAPRANATGYSYVSPGVVYKCSVSSSESSNCDYVALSRLYGRLKTNEEVDNQWLGVTVHSNTENVVMCAHRNKISASSYRWGGGMCTILNNALDYKKRLDYCKNFVSDGHVGLAHCQMGASAALDEDMNIAMGAPGSYNWMGVLFKTTTSSRPGIDSTWYKTSDSTNRVVDDYSLLGMSAGIGNIINGQKTFVAGAPRAANSGRVLMFLQVPNADQRLTFDPKNEVGIPSDIETYGAAFGHDLVVMDLNSDGKDDLVVGAPFFYEKNVGGAIFIFINGPDGITTATKPVVIRSRTMSNVECKKINCEMMRFGFSLANIGDINRDGYPDLAVGAPYEENGVVYIFHGSKDGINPKFSQRIASSDILDSPKSFGSSVSGNADLDDNGYTDLVVGAYESSKAVYVPTRPVFYVTARVDKQNSITIDPKAKRCDITKTEGQCASVKVCFKFEAQPKDKFTGRQRVKYRLTEVKETLLARTRFEDASVTDDFNTNYVIDATINMYPQSEAREACNPHTVHISKNNKDILHPIRMKLTYELDSPEPSQLTPGAPIPNINAFPLVNEAANMIDFQISFKKDCGSDKVCTADLAVEGWWEDLPMDGNVAVLSVGTVSDLTLKIKYSNTREKAYNAMLTIDLPPELNFRKGSHSEGNARCTNETSTRLVCDMGNPFDNNTVAFLHLPFAVPETVRTMLSVDMYAHTTSEEPNMDNNNATVKMRVIVRADMLISGASEPEQVIYKGEVRGESAIQFEDEIGDAVMHTYVITNGGPGTVAQSKVEIQWPYQVENKRDQGKHLLYMTHVPELEGPGQCEIDSKWVNPLDIEVARVPDRLEVSPNLRPTNESEEKIKYTPTRRRKREVVVTAEEVRAADGTIEKVVRMDCLRGTAKCFTFHCNINALTNKQDVVIRIRSRLWKHTFVEDYKNVDRVEIKSHARIILDPSLSIEQTSTSNDDASAKTDAQPDVSLRPPPEGIAIWIIIVSVCAGVLLLVILIVVLWKLGFFRRRRLEDEMQKHEVKVVKDKYKYEEVSASEC